MLLLLLLGVGSDTPPPAAPVRAYAALSFALNNDGALTYSLVNHGGITITPITNADGTVE